MNGWAIGEIIWGYQPINDKKHLALPAHEKKWDDLALYEKQWLYLPHDKRTVYNLELLKKFYSGQDDWYTARKEANDKRWAQTFDNSQQITREREIADRNTLLTRQTNQLEELLKAIKQDACEDEQGHNPRPNNKPRLVILLDALELDCGEKFVVIEAIKLEPREIISKLHQQLDQWDCDKENLPMAALTILSQLKYLVFNELAPETTNRSTHANNNTLTESTSKNSRYFTEVQLGYLPLL
jgi:hypothetical protein